MKVVVPMCDGISETNEADLSAAKIIGAHVVDLPGETQVEKVFLDGRDHVRLIKIKRDIINIKRDSHFSRPPEDFYSSSAAILRPSDGNRDTRHAD